MKDIGKGVKEINKTKEETKEEINNDTIEIVQNIKWCIQVINAIYPLLLINCKYT